MTARRRQKTRRANRPTVIETLQAVAYPNEMMEVADRPGGGCLASVPLRRPGWLVPPISWVLPFSSHRRVELDALGTEVLRMCNGRQTVEEIIENFAANHKLSFREAQLSVGAFLQQLTQRGLVAIVGKERESERG